MTACGKSVVLPLKPLLFQIPAATAPAAPIRRSLHLHHSCHPPPTPTLRLHATPYPSSPLADEDAVEELLLHAEPSRIRNLMKMERKDGLTDDKRRWFPYLDCFRGGSDGASCLTSEEVIEAVESSILDVRKEKIRRVVAKRSYSISLVVEGLSDLGNVSAAFRSADALGVQSVHVISRNERKRYKDNRHVSRGAEKWLDIELWTSPSECFEALRRRGYRIAATQMDGGVSVYDMDWSVPTAIVVGNEHAGISDEALGLSDLHCYVPMSGMVESFNVSVAAGILMHHAVCDRISRLGAHGDLGSDERRILLAEFFLRHRDSTTGIVEEYVKRKMEGVVMSER